MVKGGGPKKRILLSSGGGIGRRSSLDSPINKLWERSIKTRYLTFVLIAMENSSVEELSRSTNPTALKSMA